MKIESCYNRGKYQSKGSDEIIVDAEMETKYALMKYRAINIGDEIQSVAASRFLPRIDDYVFREELDSFRTDSQEKYKVILNGWYMHHPKHFPPSKTIDPLLISMHFSKSARNAISASKDSIEYLREHGPVGCRDRDTMRFLLDKGIPAYHSACMTLTLTENKTLKASQGGGYVLCVDVNDDIVELVRRMADKPVYRLTKRVNPFVESLDRLELAKVYLYMYHNASAVVTTNLHTALPCLSFNTPVCLIDGEKEDARFDGLNCLVNHCSLSEFMSGNFYDVNNPLANPDSFTKFRDSLTETCRKFTGYDSEAPTFDDNYKPDVMKMLQMLQHSDEGRNRAVWWVNMKNILRALVVKTYHKIFRPDCEVIRAYEYNYSDRYLR